MLLAADSRGPVSWAGELGAHEMDDSTATPGLRKMLSVRQVLALVPFSRATLYNEMGAGRFPRAREIAPRRVAWYEDDVKAWQDGLRPTVVGPQ
jgi:prophage regulatory protein